MNRQPTTSDDCPTGQNSIDLIVERYKQDVDRTLLQENLRLSTQQRSEKFLRSMQTVFQLRRASQQRRS